MTRDELKNKLSELGVHQSSYSLDGIRNSECVCLVNEDQLWKVYYVERDRPKELGVFQTESDAIEFMFKQFQHWLG
ncbi:hypothetical protein CUZ56_00268 [Saezia sanguinis]|uniref:Uncharacterized protein n=1 Tax=Saezia sanguinis TaxID=1965230 RepID=A0A433SGA6_9BURK|nr:hypothetical protein [Saezia sanguinis]RUS67791.1 hypothetical protein CUZ56_00268 [Saezia sanguinis]